MRTMPRARTLLAGTAFATILLAGGCGGSGSEDHTQSAAPRQESAAGRSAAEPAAGGAADAIAADTPAGGAGASGGKAAGGTPVPPEGQAIIATGTVSLTAKDVAAARFEVQKILDEAGGSITEEETSTDDDGHLDTARIVLRVPSTRFADTRAALEKVGTLTTSTRQSEDVTTQVIDVTARVRAQQRSVRRIEALLARAASLREIISIESELAQRQADLDSLTSQQTYLADQTSLSTLTVHLQKAGEDKASTKDRDGFVGGLADGWGAFLAEIGSVAVVLGYLLPWLVALAILGVPAWWLVRARRGRRPSPARQP